MGELEGGREGGREKVLALNLDLLRERKGEGEGERDIYMHTYTHAQDLSNRNKQT